MQGNIQPFQCCALICFPFALKFAWDYLVKGGENTTKQFSISFPAHMPVISN